MGKADCFGCLQEKWATVGDVGTAGGYQIEGEKNGMMLNIGGSAATNYVFVVGME